jgi:hypothetical protein
LRRPDGTLLKGTIREPSRNLRLPARSASEQLRWHNGRTRRSRNPFPEKSSKTAQLDGKRAQRIPSWPGGLQVICIVPCSGFHHAFHRAARAFSPCKHGAFASLCIYGFLKDLRKLHRASPRWRRLGNGTARAES